MKKQKEPIPPSILQVVSHVANIFNVSVEGILHKNRLKNNVEARHTAMYYIYNRNAKHSRKFTKKEVGDFFGGKDHTTVIHALNNVKNWLDVYPEFAERYKHLEKTCEHIILKRNNTSPKKGQFTLAERIERLPQNERDGIIKYIEKLEKNDTTNHI